MSLDEKALRAQYPFSSEFTALAKVIRANEQDRFIAKASLLPLRGLLPADIDPANSPDLLYIAAAGAVGGLVNLNGDGIDVATAVDIHRSAAAKYISLDHDREKVVGVVLYPGLTRFGSNEPISDEEALTLKEPVNMAFAGAIWKVIGPLVAKFISKTGDSTDGEVLSISWEILFSAYSIGYGSKNLFDATIIPPSDPRFKDLDKRLRQNGGNGKGPDGEELFRVITGPAIILGYSIVGNPAADVKGILPITDAPGQPGADAVAHSTIIETAQPVDLPDGEYAAMRYGYTLEIDEKSYETKDGVRCPRHAAARMTVLVKDGVVEWVRNVIPDTAPASVPETPVEPAKEPVVQPVPETAAAAQTEGKTEALKPESTENFITHAETRVTPDNATPMKIESFAKLADLWPELQKLDAKAAVESFQTAIDKANTEWEQKVNAEKDVAKNLEQAKAEAEKRAKELETSLAQMQTQVTDLKNAAAAAEANQKFQERMASFDEQYDLDDEDRQLIAADVKGMSDEAFAAYAKKQTKLMAAKKKGSAAKPTKKDPDGDGDDDTDPAKDTDKDEGKGKKAKASTEVPVKEAIASVTEIPGQSGVPAGSPKIDLTLKDQVADAFDGAFKVGGKTMAEVKAARAAKVAAADKE